LHVLLTPTIAPPTIRAQGISYWHDDQVTAQRTHFTLEFTAVECPNLALSAARWTLPFSSSMDPHGFGSSTIISWGGDKGIYVSAMENGGCSISMSQVKALGEPFALHVDTDLISPMPLLKAVVNLAASGDIRDARRAGAIFQTEFPAWPSGQYVQTYQLKSVIPGVDPGPFEYSVNDSGMARAAGFIAAPPVQVNRGARFSLAIDIHHLCMRNEQIPSALHSRGVRFRPTHQNGEDVYVMRSKNEIRVSTRVFDGCVSHIDISQITDVKHIEQ
jgi:hypothetical protein